MRTADGVPDGPGSGSAGFGSTAEALRTGPALADYLSSPTGAGLEPAAPGAAEVIPLPKMIEHAEPGGVSCTTRKPPSPGKSASNRHPSDS